MTAVEQLAGFATGRSFQEISAGSVEQLKLRVLDSLGCAIGATNAEPIRKIREHTEEFGSGGRCTLIAAGQSAPDRAAFYNGALVRYLDFNDSYLAKGETCHPSDNVAPVLAAAEYSGKDGAEFLTALAVAYEVQCRLSDVAPVRAKGFDHTVQGSYGVAAGVSRALGLDCRQTANAIAISGTAFNALRVTRTGALSNWKGLAYPNTAFGGMHSALLAMRGITGPTEVFEGNKGFMDAIAGPFEIDWAKEDLERVRRTVIKKYNAEIHSQSAIEGLLELKHENRFGAADITSIELETFEVAYNIIGGGEEGDKRLIRNKEQADHSLPYMLAVAAIDGEVMPPQYRQERIEKSDVQELLRKVKVRPSNDLSRRFPAEMPSRISVRLRDGRILSKAKHDYEGFYTRPMSWEAVARKFDRLSKDHAPDSLRTEIIDNVRKLEDVPVSRLMELLKGVGRAS